MALKFHTEVLVDKLSCEWTINNFSYCKEETGESIRSPTFSSKENDELRWSIKLCPRGETEECKDFLSLFLMVNSSCRTEVTVKYGFSLLDPSGIKTNKQGNQKKFSTPDHGWGYKKFIKRDILFDEKNRFLTNDKLTIVCDMAFLNGSTSPGCIPVQVPECGLSNDLGRLFEHHHLSDVILSTPSKEYKAHKAILAARSPVFAAMFQHEMEENRSNRVDIADVGEEVLEEVLKYLYTGKAPNLDKMADKLLIAADKYDMKRLKALCEKSLCDNLAVGNAADALAIADLHGAEVLKERAITFINRHLANVIQTAGSGQIIYQPDLLLELLRASENALNINKQDRKETKESSGKPIS